MTTCHELGYSPLSIGVSQTFKAVVGAQQNPSMHMFRWGVSAQLLPLPCCLTQLNSILSPRGQKRSTSVILIPVHHHRVLD